MQHLDEGTIHAWLDGALPPLEAEQAAKHAGECATCAAAVAEARGIIAGSARIVSALDDVPGGVLPGAGRKDGGTSGSSMWRRLRLTPVRAALAATILLAVGTTLTLRSSSSPQLKSDTSVSVVARVPMVATPAAAPATTPAARSTMRDSTKAAAFSIADASAPQKAKVGAPPPQAQTVGERREVANAPDTTRALAKARVAAQEAVAGASAAPVPSRAAEAFARRNVAANALDQRLDSATSFEGCYRVSADSSSGSTQMPRGLPASFALSRPPAESPTARRAVPVFADSIAVSVAWQQFSATQARVTFAGPGTTARPVSLVLTARSPVGLASSGDRTTKVRVVRASCPP